MVVGRQQGTMWKEIGPIEERNESNWGLCQIIPFCFISYRTRLVFYGDHLWQGIVSPAKGIYAEKITHRCLPHSSMLS